MDVTDLLDLPTVPTHYAALGSGTNIYRGRLRDRRAVAIKTPWQDKDLRKLLDMWAECRHPNIVQLIGKATFRGRLAAVFEWHEYGGIRLYLEHLPTADPYQLSAQICDGVAYLHANDIVHGNLHGNQIVVSGDGVPRIQLSIVTSRRPVDAVPGHRTWRWEAPEIVKGGKRTFANDVYSLGMTILEAVTRDRPYHEDQDLGSVLNKIKKGELPQRPTDVIPENNTGDLIWDLLCKCWSYDPENRPLVRDVGKVMHMLFRTSVGFRLIVRRDTTIDEIVSHFTNRGIDDYSEILHQASITSIDPSFDSALANVYQITLPNDQCVAVKCVKHIERFKLLKRAARELSCWASHKHENILPLLGFAVVRGKLAMVSPWMRNGHVREYVATYPECDRLRLCSQLAWAIAYLHEQKVVHGDIKGPNVLVSDTGSVQVTDFGVSIMDHEEIIFSATYSRGTERWQAPELLCGQSDSTAEADVYSLGMTMIEIYTGEQPYGSPLWPGLRQSVIDNRLRPSRPLELPIDDTGNHLWQLMNRCWAGIPGDRPTSAKVWEQLCVPHMACDTESEISKAEGDVKHEPQAKSVSAFSRIPFFTFWSKSSIM